MEFLEKLVGWLWGLPLIVTILGTGIYFTVATGFFQFLKFGHIWQQTFGKLLKRHEGEGTDGLLSPFEAVSTAIGGSVGVGNIGGVATAIAVGGPGAVFWMWIAALVGMVIKMAEVTLAVYYRSKDEVGNPYGGPTFYMEKGLGIEKHFKGWPILAFIFGAGIFSTFFITMQNYTVSEAVGNTFGIPLLAVSVAYIALVYLIISGGIPSLGKVAGRLVPFMTVFYVLAGLFIIIKDIANLPGALAQIVTGAFTGTAAVGGFAGAAMARAIQMGMARSVYSNEAGWGTSPMIHSTARTDHPVRQGLWGAFEVFVDTIIVCTITSLVIVMTGAWTSGASGATLTLTAFEMEIGTLGRYLIAVSVFLFGLTTTTGWYAYYEILLRHLFRNNVSAKDNILKIYRWTYPVPGIIMVLLAVYGELPGATLWLFADLTSAIPTFINVLVILVLSPTFIHLVKDYRGRHLGDGDFDRNFHVFYEDDPAKRS
ncbi:sodium:alanine symporter family protein [Anoxynatronum sibiricum]|uniref:Sodium:alanine symporter family protein n=1 Tax=Anoxynatronum sibiricum TaxID=210623 RepID=A0ABU9VWQ5_9CLOT